MATVERPMFNPVLAQSNLQRKQKELDMLEALLAQRSPATIQAGNVHVANWGDAIGRVADAVAANRMKKELEGERTKFATDYQAQTKQALADYMLQSRGREENAPADGMGPTLPGVKADRMAAIVGAISSGIPEVAGFANEDYKEWNKGQPSPKDLLGVRGATVGSRVSAAQAGDMALLKDDPKVVTADGVAATLDPTGNVTNRQPISQFSGPTTGPAGVPGQTNLVTNEFKGISGGNVTPIDTKIQLAGVDTDLKRISEGQEGYQKNLNSFAQLSRAETLTRAIDPAKLGPLADVRQFLSILPQLWGGQLDPSSQQYQALASALGQNLVDIIRAFAPVSNVDAQRALQIAGSTGNTQEALLAIITAARENKARDLAMYEKFVGSVANQYPQLGGEEFRRRWVQDKWQNPDDFLQMGPGTGPSSRPPTGNRKPLSAY
jgi:hypothetical protein